MAETDPGIFVPFVQRKIFIHFVHHRNNVTNLFNHYDALCFKFLGMTFEGSLPPITTVTWLTSKFLLVLSPGNNFMTDKSWAHSVAVLILIDYCHLFLNDVMDSADWLGEDSWYHAHDIVKAEELSMEHMTPISTYLHYFEHCNPVRQILNDHCQSVWDVKGLWEWHYLSLSILSREIWLTL